MRELSSDYISGSAANARDVYVKIALNDDENTVYEADKILSLNIQRGITDGSFGIGFTPSDRLSCSIITDSKIPEKTRITVYIRFSSSGTWERLGRFYCKTCIRNGSAVNVTAFDAMEWQKKKQVKFDGKASIELSALSFPCTMQQMLDYIVALRGMTCDFKCQDFMVQELPKKNDTEYYTVAELLGFIASAHGCNVKFGYGGRLEFKSFAPASAELNSSNVIDQALDDSETFTVKGILFYTGNDTKIYIDDVPGSEFDEDGEGIVKCTNPFASEQVAEYVWGQLGGLSYYGGNLELRGAGIIECGDVITVGNLKYPEDTASYPLCITDITYSISRAEGFTETVSSKITETKDSVSNTSPQSSSGSGVGKNAGNNSEIFNRYEGSSANVIDGAYSSHAEGAKNKITGTSFASHAEGSENRISSSKSAHAEGAENVVSIGDYAHIEGIRNQIISSAWGAHAGGTNCRVTAADCGFAHGLAAQVTGHMGTAFGNRTLAAGRNQFVIGAGNIEDTEDKYALIVGNSINNTDRGSTGFNASNALTLDWEGNLWVAGAIKAEGGGGTGGTTYSAGDGISISDDKISVKPATASSLGGVKAGEGIEIAADGTISTESKQSLTAGDGIDIADGIISVKPASANSIGGVKAGDGLEISEDGTLSVTGGGEGGSYTAGNGIEITDENSINLKQATASQLGGIILGDGFEYDEATGKTNTVPNIQQAVIIQEADAAYLLHEYTTVEYIAGNKICYAGAQSPIIVNGRVLYLKGRTAPNGNIVNIPATGASVPDIPVYSELSSENGLLYYNYNGKYHKRLYLELKSAGATNAVYSLMGELSDGSIKELGSITHYGSENFGITFIVNSILQPNSTYPYGYINGYFVYLYTQSDGTRRLYAPSSRTDNMYDFTSESEYNAAIGLTYEPNVLQQVNETITPV